MFKLLAGEGYNLLPRMRIGGPTAAYVTSSPALMATGPYSFLWDGAVSPAARFSYASASPYFDFDMTAIVNYGQEDGTSSPWSGGGIAAASDQKHTGTYALKGTVSGAYGYVDIQVRPGEQWQFIGWNRGDGQAAARFMLNILDSGQYWNGTGWTTTLTVVGSNATTTWTQYTATFTVPSFSELLRPLVTLRVYIFQSAVAGSTWYDDILLIPGVNLVAVLGHNVPSRAPVKATSWGGEAYQSGGTGTGTMTNFQPGVSAIVSSMVFARSWRVFFDDTVSNAGYAPRVGEIILGQTVDLLKNPSFPIRFTAKEPGQIRNMTRDGAETVMNSASRAAWSGLLSFQFAQASEYKQLRDALIYSGRSGGFPAVIIPTETDSDLLLFGHMSEQGTAFNRLGQNVRQAEFTFNEEVPATFLMSNPVTGT